MSGGRFNYLQQRLGDEIFDNAYVTYGLDKKEHTKSIRCVRKQNPLEDKVISEIAYDVLCLIHSYDWYASGDNCEDIYRKDVAFFKKKWLKKLDKEYVQTLIDEEIQVCKEELRRALMTETL